MLFLMPNLCINVFHSLPSLDYNFPAVWIKGQGSFLLSLPVPSPEPGQEAAWVAIKASFLPCSLSVPPTRLGEAALAPWTPVSS